MVTQKVKTLLLKLLGVRAVSALHAVRFITMLSSRQHTDPEFKLLGTLLGKGDIAIDVGAHSANWTYRLHKAVGPGGLVYAFEADPYSARVTGLAIKLLGLKGVTLFPFGLSEREEEVPMRVANDEGTRLAAITHVDRSAAATDRGVELIRLKTLDSLVNEHPALLKTALIKCDVEGYELFVFRGAGRVLDEARPFVILEVGMFENQGYTASDVNEFFRAKSYQAFALTDPSHLTPTDGKLEVDRALSVNRLLVPTEKLGVVESWLPEKAGLPLRA